MTKLIYDKSVELDGKVIASTEVLTRFECWHCGKWSIVSDLEDSDKIVYCTYCGEVSKLPPANINSFLNSIDTNFTPTEADIEHGKMLARELKTIQETWDVI